MLIRWPLHLCSCHWDGVSLSFVPFATVAPAAVFGRCGGLVSPSLRLPHNVAKAAAQREYVQAMQTTGARNTRMYKHPTFYR